MVHVQGAIVGRRILGKHLTFCDILPNTVEDVATEPIQLTFNHHFTVLATTPFPNKPSRLPFGAIINAECNVAHEVSKYAIVFNPANAANAVSSNPDGSINLSDLLKYRSKCHVEATAGMSSSTRKRRRASTPVPLTTTTSTSTSTSTSSSTSSSTNTASHAHQGDKRMKSKRAVVFAEWLIQTYGIDLLQQGVLDVAGGKGKLSVELTLASRGQIQCTVVDPLVRKRPIGSGDKRKLKKQQLSPPQFLHQSFNQHTFLQQQSTLIERLGILVGLHPDQVTEDIVDVALQMNKPCAVVPCCVFPELFSHRQLANGTQVVTSDDFVNYLVAKDPERMSSAELDFEGRNVVVFMKPIKKQLIKK